MSIFKDEKIWRILTYHWTGAFMIFITINFFLKNKYDFLLAPLSVVYISVLGLYVGTKEFDRWYEFHDTRHPGEVFVLVWTVLIFTLLLLPLFLGDAYKLSTEAVADYIMVLSVFALTQKSKRLHARKRGRSR